jgi:hypothetical protein
VLRLLASALSSSLLSSTSPTVIISVWMTGSCLRSGLSQQGHLQPSLRLISLCSSLCYLDFASDFFPIEIPVSLITGTVDQA